MYIYDISKQFILLEAILNIEIMEMDGSDLNMEFLELDGNDLEYGIYGILFGKNSSGVIV